VSRFVAVLVVLFLVGGCTAETVASAPSGTGKPVSLSVGATVDTSPHLKVSVPGGAVDRPAVLSVVRSDVAPPKRAGLVLAAVPVEVSVDAPLLRAVQLVFDGVGGPEGALPVVLHHDAELGWYPVEAGDPGKPVVAERTSLSPFAIGWITDSVGWITDRLVGRGEPPVCAPGAPSWARVTASKVDLVTSCLTQDGTKARLRVRNNRAMPLELSIPSGSKAIAVDGQPEVVRQVLGALRGKDKVLLLSGQELVVDWVRPERDTRIGIRAAFSATSVLPGVAAEALGADDSSTLLALATFLAKCSAAQNETLRSLGSPELLGAAMQALIECLGPMTTSSGAAAAATSTIAALNGVSEAVAVSDRTFVGKVDGLANGLRVLGKIVKFYTVAKLVAALGQVVADSSAGEADRSIVVELTGTKVSTPAMTAKDLYHAPVPSLCRHPAGTLVDGSLPGIPEQDGHVDLRARSGPTANTLVFGDLTGDGTVDAAAVFACSRGGVSWPAEVVLYAPGPKVLGVVDLGDLTPAEHSEVKKMTLKSGDVALEWESYEGAGYCFGAWSARIHWDGKKAVAVGLARTATPPNPDPLDGRTC
jgi:hypothetical protein